MRTASSTAFPVLRRSRGAQGRYYRDREYAGEPCRQAGNDKNPIVFAASSDPISTGVVASLAHPGGNITGLSLMASDLSAKRLELIHTLVPRVSRIAVVWDFRIPAWPCGGVDEGRRRTIQGRLF